MHEEMFRRECVKQLVLLKENKTLDLGKGVKINNVRELVKFFGISSFSIYKWYREFEYNGELGSCLLYTSPSPRDRS